MARPRLETTVVTVHINLSLRQDEDEDLITFFARIPPGQRARAVKQALRSGGVTLVEVALDEDDDDFVEALGDMIL